MIARVQYLLIVVGAALITACAGPRTLPASPASNTKATQAGSMDCSLVERISPTSAEAGEIEEYLLPVVLASATLDIPAYKLEFSEVRSIDRLQDWIILQADFTVALEPAIFVIQTTSGGYHYLGVGWAGQAEKADQIRAALAADFPDVPAELVACIEPAEWFLSGQAGTRLIIPGGRRALENVTAVAPMVTPVQEAGETTPTPACSPILPGMSIRLSSVAPDAVQIEVSGLEPGETPVVFMFTESEDRIARLTFYPRDPAGEDGAFAYTMSGIAQYLEEPSVLFFRVVHSQGVACAEWEGAK